MQNVDLHLLQFLLVLDAPTMHTSTPPAEQGTYNFFFSYIFFSEHAHILRNNHCMQGAICRGGSGLFILASAELLLSPVGRGHPAKRTSRSLSNDSR